MNLGRFLSVKIAGLVLAAPVLLAASDTPAARPPIPLSARRVGAGTALRTQSATPAATTATCSGLCYSAELPQIVRAQGAAFYRTAVDITNNTTRGGVIARIQLSYANAACTNSFCRSTPLTIPLAGLDNFHTDDMVQFLDSQGLLVAGAVGNTVGTLLVTFDNLPSATGWEGTATARLYNRVNEADPSQGTIGYAYPASLFFESAHETVVGIARDTTPAALASASTQGSQRTNVGVRNTDIASSLHPGTDRHVSVDLTFYDVTEGSATNGQKVGDTLTSDNMVPGEVRLFGNVFSSAHLPTNVSSVIAFIDVRNATAASPTIEGFVVIIDNMTTDGSYFEMKCADSDALNSCGLSF